MNILAWILFGLIVGIIAHAIDQSENEKEFWGSILLGIVGALFGGFLSNLIFSVSLSAFNSMAFLIAIAGSLLVLFFGKALRKI